MTKEMFQKNAGEIINSSAVCGVEMYACLRREDDFILRKMLLMNTLQDSLRKLLSELMNQIYLDSDAVYDEAYNLADNKKAIFHVIQDESYCPLANLSEKIEENTFSMDSIDDVAGFFFRMNRNDNSFWIYQHAYVGSKLSVHSDLFRIHWGREKFELFSESILKIDRRIEFVVWDREIWVKNVKILQSYFGFERYARARARHVIDLIEQIDIVDDIAKFREYQEGTD